MFFFVYTTSLLKFGQGARKVLIDSTKPIDISVCFLKESSKVFESQLDIFLEMKYHVTGVYTVCGELQITLPVINLLCAQTCPYEWSEMLFY